MYSNFEPQRNKRSTSHIPLSCFIKYKNTNLPPPINPLQRPNVLLAELLSGETSCLRWRTDSTRSLHSSRKRTCLCCFCWLRCFEATSRLICRPLSTSLQSEHWTAPPAITHLSHHLSFCVVFSPSCRNDKRSFHILSSPSSLIILNSFFITHTCY